MWILENMGITEPQLGMDITLDIQDNTEEQQRTFKLSGYFTSYAYNRLGDESIFVSQAFAEESEHTVAEYKRVQIQFINNNYEYREQLLNDAQIDWLITTVKGYIHTAKDNPDPIIYVYAVIAVFLAVAGFLLIYNVMSMSVSRDIRFYGLMKTIGMTQSQIRNMVLRQILRICVVAIPAGLAFSALTSFVVVPWFTNNTTTDFMRTGGVAVSFNPFIFIGAAVFVLLTVLLGAFKPAKKAAGISPIEAVRFSERGYSEKQFRSSKFNPLKVAWRNVFRVRERSALVFFGMFIGMTMFLLISIIIGGTDIDVYVKSTSKNINGDIYLINRMPDFANSNDFDNYEAFTPDLIERLKLLPGLIDMKMRYVQIIKKDSGYLDMQGNINYILDFIYVSENGEIAEFDNDLHQLVGEPVIYEIDLYIEPAEQIQALDMVKTLTNTRQYIQWRSGIETRIEIEQQLKTLMIMGGSISAIIFLIGVFNFISIITTNILSRRHEIALLESIGQSPKQSKIILTLEGAIYAVITLLLVGIFGGSIIYILFSFLASQYDYLVFSLPYIPLLLMGCVIFAVCLSVPRLTYRFISKMTLVERLREVE